MRKIRGLGETKEASFSTTLANATKEAARAARVEKALERGASALWAGSVFVGASVCLLERNAAAVGRNVVLVLATAVGVFFFVALRKKTEPKERRSLALLGARRLEKRFKERKGEIVAAVEFCEEKSSDATECSTTTSDALREATVVAAARWYAETASKLDAAERNALLSDWPVEHFRKTRRRRLVCALGVLLNLTIWGVAGIWEEWRETNEPTFASITTEVELSAVKNGKDKENRENKKEKEKEKGGAIEESKRTKEDDEGDDGETDAEKQVNDEAISASALELLISELAQNAEIAEFLEAELKRAADEQNSAVAPPDEATQLLLSARELEKNLARPATGLIAQTRRLNEIARRERRRLMERWRKLGEEDFASWEEDGGSDAASKNMRQRIVGKEVAVYLLAARLKEFESVLSAPNGVGDVLSLGLSRVLRNDSATERKKTLNDAASRVGEWAATLRREETATRLLIESWRFDAASLRREAMLKNIARENRASLTRFAGRLTLEIEETRQYVAELEEAKRLFELLRRGTQDAEKECFASFGRLRERLQNEGAREFVEFAEEAVGWAERTALASAEADEAVGDAWSDAASYAEEMWRKTSEHVANNRFGRAAESLENNGEYFLREAKTTRLVKRPAPKRNREEKKDVGSIVEIKEVDVENNKLASERTENEQAVASRRFSALASLLTLGVDAERFFDGRLQVAENEGNTAFIGREDDAFSTAKKRSGDVGDASTKDNEQREIFNAEDLENRKSSPKDARAEDKGRTANDETTKRVVNAENNDVDEMANAGLEGADVAIEREFGSENGANSGAVGRAKEEKRVNPEPTADNGFSGELPAEARRRFERTDAPKILPEYEEKIRLYRRRIFNERR